MSQFWKAKVDCYTQYAEDDRVCTQRQFILMAGDADTAWDQAAKHATATSPFGPTLVRVEVREVASLTLPYEIKKG